MLEKIKFWLQTHTMHPLAWPYVLLASVYYKLFSPKRLGHPVLFTVDEYICPVCGQRSEITEQGLCEKCGNIII